ncbi:unnamed protein product [Cuscuta epithymum]|uniref:Uncharacterized protein n=1 Tax=Cuscuta epithymum TaxID=186058 RepID=A0AAV0FSS1_9ASTE|nr:unnamed protein product [Cuscuta epithymum]
MTGSSSSSNVRRLTQQTVTMQMVTDALMNEEARRKEAGNEQSYALVSETSRRGGGRNGGRGRGRGRGRARGQSRGRSQARRRSQERGKFVDTNTWFEGYCNHCGRKRLKVYGP